QCLKLPVSGMGGERVTYKVFSLVSTACQVAPSSKETSQPTLKGLDRLVTLAGNTEGLSVTGDVKSCTMVADASTSTSTSGNTIPSGPTPRTVTESGVFSHSMEKPADIDGAWPLTKATGIEAPSLVHSDAG